jgi:hypothetical protein
MPDMVTGTWRDLIFDALVEIGVYNPNDSFQAEDAQFAARKLQRIIDQWAALERFAYTVDFTLYTLTPNHSPILIGPGLTAPDFAAVRRPVRIVSAALVLNQNPPATDLPLNIRDEQWWAGQRVKAQTSQTPTDLYYKAAFPNGEINLWPIATFASGLRLETWVQMSQVPQDLTTTFVAPPAYENATMLSLAEELCGPYTRPVPGELPAKAMRARAALQGNNSASPRCASADYGTSGRRRGSTFNYQTGMPGGY